MMRTTAIRPLAAMLLASLILAACTGPVAPSIVSVTIDDGERSVAVGATLPLTATVDTVGGATPALSWSSNDTNTATVSPTGVVTGNTAGQARITATSQHDTSKTDSVLITVTEAPAIVSVIINEPSTVLTIGSTTSFTATIHATSGASPAINWHSDNPSVATIDDDGLVEAHAIGVAAITATSVYDPSKHATVAIAVQAPPDEPGVPATITVLTGNTQTTTVASAVPIPPTVRVSDPDDTPLANASVTFTITAGNGTIAPTTPVTTDTDGIARLASWTLGTTTGPNTLQATVTDTTPAITTTFTATARPAAPSPTTSTVSANPTTLLADSSATSQITIQLKDQHGNHLDTGGSTITFATPTHGSISPATDHGNGTYTSTYTAGTTASTITITPRIAGTNFTNPTTITLTAAVLNVTIDQTDPTLHYGDTLHLTASVHTAGGASTNVTWSSSDSTVATIEPTTGIATATTGGTTTITATSTHDPEQRHHITLTVPEPMTINIDIRSRKEVALRLGGHVDVTIHWGDGNRTVATRSRDVTDPDYHIASHTYQQEGTYTIKIAGSLEHFAGGTPSIREVVTWGDLGLTSLARSFESSYEVILPTTLPATVTDISYMFWRSVFSNEYIEGWDTSNVTNMRGLFGGSASGSVNLVSWDVARVTDMSWMFASPDTCVAGTGGWDVSSVTDMHRMFSRAGGFNADISAWDVSSVTDMSWMFFYTYEFDQPLSTWDVSSVTDMSGMFAWSVYDNDISRWDVSNVTDMQTMFEDSYFNQDISGWDVSNVTNMSAMFSFSRFNHDISDWDVSNVTDMRTMFADTFFNQDLSRWCVSRIPEAPIGFDAGADSWTLPRPVWGTCPSP